MTSEDVHRSSFSLYISLSHLLICIYIQQLLSDYYQPKCPSQPIYQSYYKIFCVRFSLTSWSSTHSGRRYHLRDGSKSDHYQSVHGPQSMCHNKLSYSQFSIIRLPFNVSEKSSLTKLHPRTQTPTKRNEDKEKQDAEVTP